MRFDFANLLFGGPCNLRCPECIGRALPPGSRADTLACFPPPGLDRFLARLRAHGVRELSLSGTSTDPLLYLHQEALLSRLRAELPGLRLSLHTNGLLALEQAALLRRYDRATISIPSFDPARYRRLTGSRRRPPELGRLIEEVRIPIKLSVLCARENLEELAEIAARCRALGLRRLVLRRRYGDQAPGWEREVLHALGGDTWIPRREHGGNPVFEEGGLEITLWDFARATLGCLSLLPSGRIAIEYTLARAVERREVADVAC